MSESILRSNWDVLLIMLPFLVMMAVGMFRLDEHLFASKAQKPREGHATAHFAVRMATGMPPCQIPMVARADRDP